jgi:hypothetical protein
MIKRLQLEINSRCLRSCGQCLPRKLKTGKVLSLAEIRPLAAELTGLGFEAITLAGYGSAVDHPEFAAILNTLDKPFRVSVVCRPEEFGLCAKAAQVLCSVQSESMARCLVETLGRSGPLRTSVSTHTVTRPWLRDDLQVILMVLTSSPHLSRVNVADTLKLCDDPAHVAAVRNCSQNRLELIDILDRARRELANGDKITQQLEGHFPEKCAFHDDLIYVDADLKVRRCCHQPVSDPLGDLHREKLPDVLAKVQEFQANWRQHPACRRCPDTGKQEKTL